MTIIAYVSIAVIGTMIAKSTMKGYIHDREMEELDKEILANGGEIYDLNGLVRRAA